MPQPDEESCENCRFWDRIDAGPVEQEIVPGLTHLTMYGYCLRYPPAAQPDESRVAVPLTNYTDWCGEWKKERSR